MTIEAIFLYGSWARGDQGEGSDKDLIMVTNEERGYHVTDGHHSMTYAPLASLKDKAALGDLFVYHLIREAKSVLDPNDVLATLRKSFKQKASYLSEISHGSDMGWFLVHNHVALSAKLAAKRIAWAVRTILIARSVMRGAPTFAPDKLSAFSTFPNTELLIAARHGHFSDKTIHALEAFLELEGFRPPLGPEAGEAAWRRQFAETGNYVGVQLMKSLDDEEAPPYG
ncbi:nucleotidyltransferase domain-containing protein [Pseudorhizobium marinum]|uniref:nucleotidyltransferase domain-containing protein n=1 Tax=Pseudorhizobium marinum TaxID=1496690 RepID=UPI00068DBCEC|nr:nucleotidyltransferase domain-containing protein [Pseudorhizobium marinum]